MEQSQNDGGSSRGNPTEASGRKRKRVAECSASNNPKPSNFPASSLKIGTWECISNNKGNLVAKFYFGKKQLVWEVLDGDLKRKIVIQWDEIKSLRAYLPDDGPGALTLELAQVPSFFEETDREPNKNIRWKERTDFTGGHASSITNPHFLQCAPGILNKHYNLLIQCDTRLGRLSQQPESEESSGHGGNIQPHAAKGSPISALKEVASFAGPQLAVQGVSKEAESTSSVYGCGEPVMLSSQREALENISRGMLSDSDCSADVDEGSLMKAVNDLRSVLLDPAMASTAQGDPAKANVNDSTHEKANFEDRSHR